MPARAGPSRSQRASQSQRVHDNDGSDNEMDLDDGVEIGGANGDDHLEKKARDLVRLALFSEHKRVPLRRDDINKKVLGPYTRSFNSVLFKAQVLLRKTFAMELVELQARNHRDEDPADQNATGVKKRATATGSKTYILRSTLDPVVVEQAALSDERLLEQEIAEAPDEDEEEDTPRNYGSIIAWSSADQLAALGLLHVILALILVNGRVISELDLRANLKRLRISQNGTIPLSAQSTHRSMSIDTFLQQVVRQGYLDRVRLDEPKLTGKRRGRISATQTNINTEDDPQAYEWRWGSRAHSEIGEQAVGMFIGEFMVEQTRMGDGEDEDGEERRGHRRKQKEREGEREKRLETMVKGIERAAGGELSELK